MTERAYDIVIVGGGINGAAVARDAAGRGYRVLLVERDDYAAATSSASSKLVHGGIRYLEHAEFRLVRESLHERAVLLSIAPHLVAPLRFLLPITRSQPRPAWMVSLGLTLYDVLAGRHRLEGTGRLTPAESAGLSELRTEDTTAILRYPDCWTDDARLTLCTLLDARQRGADIRNRCEAMVVVPMEAGYRVELRDRGTRTLVTARAVVNASGPWADRLLQRVEGRTSSPVRLRLVRGSHIVVAARPDSRPEAYTLQHDDGRVVFVIPWLGGRFRIIGTTDISHDADPTTARCTAEERDYLIGVHNRYFRRPIAAADVVWSWSGVRPLVDDGADRPSKVTRDFRLQTEARGKAALLTVFGGKLTTHRVLAERVLAALEPTLGFRRKSWTAFEPITGGDLPLDRHPALAASGPMYLAPALRSRWVATYGSVAADLFEAVRQRPALAREVAPGICEAELRHSSAREDAVTAEDFLYRRTKTFIDLDPTGRNAVRRWFGEQDEEAAA